MQLVLSTWTHHLNQLIYSVLYFCEREKINLSIIRDQSIVHNGGLLLVDGKTVFFDYSDDPIFISISEKYDFYFKRSLLVGDKLSNVFPLNFNVPISYKPHRLIWNLKTDLLFDRFSRIEVFRALDLFGIIFKSSHHTLDVKRYPSHPIDFGGKVIFHTRLWNPDNHPDSEEKERRNLQNDFRINSCRIIKKNFRKASVGLFADNLSQQMAPDLLLPAKESNKKNYLCALRQHDIGIADDGLKDTPGWKIGEYLLYGKAVITTPINIVLDDFSENVNFLNLTSRSSYEELPSRIEELLKNKNYLEMANNNFAWSRRYLHPANYINRILSVIECNAVLK